MSRYNKENIVDFASKIDNKLQNLFSKYDLTQEIHKSILYSLVGSGKKFRAYLLYVFAKELNVDEQISIYLGSVVEMLHSSTLIHDDLPCMDNDDYRRGKLSNHKKFSESTALLAGDALMNEAYLWVADDLLEISSDLKIKIIKHISFAMSASSVFHGQILDLSFKSSGDKFIDKKNLLEINLLKTSRLIALPCKIAFELSEKSKEEIILIEKYAEKLGLIFQIIDDFNDLDDEATNLVRVLGEKDANFLVDSLCQECKDILEGLNLSTLDFILDIVLANK